MCSHPCSPWAWLFYSLDGLHPLLLLFRAGGRDPVHNMVPLHHTAICLCLARFDDLPFMTGVVQLKAVLVERRDPSQGQGGRGGCKALERKDRHREISYRFSRVLHLPDAEVLQRDDPPGLLVLEERCVRQGLTDWSRPLEREDEQSHSP